MGKREKKSDNVNMLIAFVVLICIILGITLFGIFFMKPAPEIIQGEVEATEIRISSKVPGRIEKYLIEEGSYVNENDTLFILESSDIEAK